MKLTAEYTCRPDATSLFNLHLILQNALGLRMWEIVPLCSNLRYLSFYSQKETASRIPANIATSTNLFCTLTRISLRGVLAKSVRFLIQALNETTFTMEPRRLPLTHVRLDVKCSLLKRDVAFQLVDALSHASIRVLYWAQLQYVKPDILDHIALKLPLLESLTLRHVQRVMSEARCTSKWPYPMHEYASALRHFPKLEFSGFNNDMRNMAYTPLFLTEAEVDYAETEEKDKVARRMVQVRRSKGRAEGYSFPPQKSRLLR